MAIQNREVSTSSRGTMKDRRIIVSIDFGTTYSGVAWAETSRPDIQHVVSSWPSTNSFKSSAKVPTELRKVATGWQWGFEIPESAKRIRFFKLKLDDAGNERGDGETPEQLTKIYLSCLHEHFISILEKTLSSAVVRSTPMDFVVTVPAIWSNAAKEATERAAAVAGFCGNSRIQLISEPEAAALYTLKNLSPATLQLGKKFVVCDAGGGTVDLITYEVTRVDKLELKEVTEGTGGRCGSSMLNKRFRRHLKQTHSDKYWSDERLVSALNEFESFKKDFSPRGEPITLKMHSSLGLRRNRYTMPQDEMKTKIFDPIIKDIICLVKEQISMAGGGVTAVVLVGGFGQSRYLKSKVRDATGSGTQVLQPEDGWVAVVKGAVIHGLSRYGPMMAPVEVASRVARRSYGTCLLARYDMMRHDPREAYWSEKEEELVVAEMLWFIRKGESYPEGKPSTIEYQCDIPVTGHGFEPQTEIEIFCSDEATPSKHVDRSVRVVATLSLDLNKIPSSVKRTAQITRMGYHRYYTIEGAIEASYGSAKITYSVKLGASSMADRSYGKVGFSVTGAYGAGNTSLNDGPPPSTLAAQLVENISPSAKSSRSDENSELKGLFAEIQKVKDDPSLLKTVDERIEHNHMLIYVYSRIILENIKLDDPFLDRAHMRTEVLKAINFMRFTIKETPLVLKQGTGRSAFLYRGKEPLWIWLLPQLLKMLGHSQCLEIEESIEGFIQYLLVVMARTGALWELASSMSSYLRSILSTLLSRLQKSSVPSPREDPSVDMRLPSNVTLEQMLGPDWLRTTHGVQYTISKTSQALRQTSSLVRVLAFPFLSHDPTFTFIAPLPENGPWLLDILLDMHTVQKRWDIAFPKKTISLLELALEIMHRIDHDEQSASFLLNKLYVFLVLICSELVMNPKDLVMVDQSGDDARLSFCKALVTLARASIENRAVGRFAESKLVIEFTREAIFEVNSDNWRASQLLTQAIALNPSQGLDENVSPSSFQNPRLQSYIKRLQFPYASCRQLNTAKKPKLRHQASESWTNVLRILCAALELKEPEDDISGLEGVIIKRFPESSESNQCQILDALSKCCCVLDGAASFFVAKPGTLTVQCSVCEIKNYERQQVPPNVRKDDIQRIFSSIIQLDSLSQSRRPRIIAMMALRRLALHSNDLNFLNLERSGSGQWCLKSLNSSLRELRIAAGRTLVAFLIVNKLPTKISSLNELIRKNRQNTISLLKSLSEKHQSQLIETCILAWGQLGRVGDEEELNLVLIQLLEYLGNSNNVVSAFAFNELMILAESRGTTPRRLLDPYWRNLAYLTTKDMVHRPQRSRAVAELLQMSISELLLLIQAHALPWLVLEKRQDVIQKLADARQESDPEHVIMNNLAPIITLLLVQEVEDVTAFANSRIAEIAPKLHHTSLVELIRSDPVLLAMEFLKAAGDADPSRKPLVQRGFQTMASIMLAGNKEARSKKANIIGLFLQDYLLGLIAQFANMISDPFSNNVPIIEQRRYIRALDEMIKFCKGYARIARPQISACLLSALTEEGLREAAFTAWASMLYNLDTEDVEALLETTFFITRRYWALLGQAAVLIVKDMLNFLLEKYKAVIRMSYINKLPPLSGLPGLEPIEAKLEKLRPVLTPETALEAYSQRIGNDNSGVVQQALVELATYLKQDDVALVTSTTSQQPGSIIPSLLRALLDCAYKYNGLHVEISRLVVECIGLVGCVDSNQVEAAREHRSIVILDNFEKPEEVSDFGLFILEEVLVPAFLSATDTKIQGFLSYAMQELLERCDIKTVCSMQDTGVLSGNEIYRKWMAIPENVREVLEPFLRSKYIVAPMAPTATAYPVFRPGKPYATWLRTFVLGLLQMGQNPHADMLFEPLSRVIRVKDLSTAEFLLPYLVAHVIIGENSGTSVKNSVLEELKLILEYEAEDSSPLVVKEDMKRFYYSVFRVLDYLMRWVQNKRSVPKLTTLDKESLTRVQRALDLIPAQLIAQRAIQCNEYARALFHLEQHAQNVEQKKSEPGERVRLLEQLQDIYANIDEPDGLDGISAHLPALDLNQQILGHKKAGRWGAAQTWYEMQLVEEPDNSDVQLELLNCLKQAGQHDNLLNHVEGIRANSSSDNRIMPFAVEAAWVTGRWESLDKFTNRFQGSKLHDFNMSIAYLFDSLHAGRGTEHYTEILREIRESVSSSLNASATTSLRTAHEQLLRSHVLTDIEMIITAGNQSEPEHRKLLSLLDNRLNMIGAYSNDKQYLLGVRRAAMMLTKPKFATTDISGLWLSSARLARKTNLVNQSFNAVLHASRLGDNGATLENAKLLWRDGHHRKAIQLLQGAIEQKKFMTQTGPTTTTGTEASIKENGQEKLLTARAQLLLAKWLDAAGQTNATALREKYQQPAKTCSTWEKGHYYLGRHYKKVLESEKSLKADDQSDYVVTGEIARLVIENYMRSLNYGTKFLYQTLPRILTLWLDIGADVDRPPEGKASVSRELQKRRVEQLNNLHQFLDKYIQRLPAYIFYTALPQVVARIAHPNPSVFDRLTHIIVKVVEAHPRQALWGLIGVMTSRQVSERKARATQILQALRNGSKKVEGSNYDLKSLLRMGERLAEQLLLACQNGDFHGNKTVRASLTRDLRFNAKCTPCPLVVPVESSLTCTLPAVSEFVKRHQAFSRDVVTIDSFQDDVLVLSSLAKPRRLTARGSDGKNYMLLIKPKDDLRTDQRLMEFNGMINRSLKRDAESSKRQLYIRTYAVVPLNEECGIIEWVPGLKTMRDILLNLYSIRKIYPDYMSLKQVMEEASTSESKIRRYIDEVVGRFPPVLHLWFIQQFPNPSAWFDARLRYTRSCAVMSMVGTILGLGDRHGENVNLEEGNGGIFHVDFNCLFDKGLTFAKPERVPFRLTHNMVTAMGIYGYEGPFRKSSELTLSILRQQEETLMTVLESFIYDPTLDLQKDKRTARKGDQGGIKLQPQSVVDSIKRKVKGLLPNESIPLSVEGQVEELIKQAVDPRNLTSMYIGWCPFL
ncbi:unnamed protein product [Clonostachys solani]|uniref:Serine/threonine-protein kinase MEC1 n=1 Tax=Clonostachys solani TaxID=160281 RepID=A0A9N9W0U8_9HYPO|nr:unnamed protein product [Clonostachys solani]